MTTEQRIELLPLLPMGNDQMSYADRLKAMVNHAPERTTYNGLVTPYHWAAEASQKRPIK